MSTNERSFYSWRMPRVSDDHLAARRRQILDAARRCFRAKGLQNTTMQDLIQEADLSVGAVYRYFKSKTDIVAAIAEEIIRRFDPLLAPDSPTGPPTLLDGMRQVLRLVDQELGPDGVFPVALQVWGAATTDPALAAIVRERYTEIRTRLAILAAAARETGELPADADPDAVAATLLSIASGYALQRTLTGSPDLDTYLDGVRVLLSRP